jgi:hypothetical protein
MYRDIKPKTVEGPNQNSLKSTRTNDAILYDIKVTIYMNR